MQADSGASQAVAGWEESMDDFWDLLKAEFVAWLVKDCQRSPVQISEVVSAFSLIFSCHVSPGPEPG